MLTSAAAQLTTGRRLQARLYPQSCCLVHALAFCKEPEDVTIATSSLTTAVNQQVNTDFEVTNEVLPERQVERPSWQKGFLIYVPFSTYQPLWKALLSSPRPQTWHQMDSPSIGHGLRFTTWNLWFEQQLYKWSFIVFLMQTWDQAAWSKLPSLHKTEHSPAARTKIYLSEHWDGFHHSGSTMLMTHARRLLSAATTNYKH